MPAPSTLNPSPALAQALLDAAQFVLETMFFVESEPALSPPLPPEGWLLAEVSFTGDKRGRLILSLPEPCARSMAAGFEGIPDEAAISEAGIRQAVLELSNMICGATLTRLHPEGLFRLGSPGFASAQSAPANSTDSECWLLLPGWEGAMLHLAFGLDETPLENHP